MLTMRISESSITTLLRFFLCFGIFATSVFGRYECGTVITDDHQKEMRRTLASSVDLDSRQTTTTGNTTEYDFGIYFNVVASNMTIQGGWVPQKQIDDQITLMNSRYEGTGIRFHLLGVTRIISKYWHETVAPYLSQTRDMHNLFHKGGTIHLNIFTVGFYDSNLNGYSSLPSDYRADPILDGVVLFFATLPGGASRERQGGTLVHETGHWLGLAHTFFGGCNGIGDGVADTPPEAAQATGCPIGRRSCPNSNLPDPIHNFMDYTDENCRTEFTPGQVRLMRRTIAAIRNNPNV